MAMLQRRFASSVYAVRRSLERMRDKREKILADPEGYRQEQMPSRLPEDFDELPEDERQEIMDRLEEVVASVDPAALREEIAELSKLIDQARLLEEREVEVQAGQAEGSSDASRASSKIRKMKLLVFTEHKDTLDYLAGDGKMAALGKLRSGGSRLPRFTAA